MNIFFSLLIFYFMTFQIDLHLVILYLIVVSQISISSTNAFFASISFSSQLAQLFFLTYGRINLFWDLKSENWVRKRERYVFELIRSIQPIVSITHLVLLRVNLFRRNMIWKKKNKMSDREFSSISFFTPVCFTSYSFYTQVLAEW